MFGNLFREEAAVARSERQRLDYLLRISAPHEHIILTATIAVLAAFVIWAFFSSISRSVTLNGVVVASGPLSDVVILEPGYLLDFDVSPGDSVALGDSIARQTVPALEREIAMFQGRSEILKMQIASNPQNFGLAELLDATQVALIQLEEQHSIRAKIVSHAEGAVTAIRGKPGDHLQAGTVIGQIRHRDATERRVIAQVPRKTAARLNPGMPVEIQISTPEGGSQSFKGSIASVAAEQPSYWLTSRLNIPAGHDDQVSIKFDNSPDLTLPEGSACQIRIQLDRGSPAKILNVGRS